MQTNWTKTNSGTRKTKPSSGLVIPAMVAALLMAAALVGCNDKTVVAVHAEAVGQDNGGLRDTLPTVNDYERVDRRSFAAPEAVNHTPRADARHAYSGY
jgi:hypothetical protein